MYLLLLIPIIAAFITFLLNLTSIKEPDRFSYEYNAKTLFIALDHKYLFTVEKLDREYRCYIERSPDFRGRSKANYQDHCWRERSSNRRYICWTGKIKYAEQAKTLCRNWADATQQFIDTGVPLPAFRR